MTLADRYELAAHFAGGVGAPGGLRVETFGPGEEDWAVLDQDGHVAYVGPAMFAARYAADALR